MGEVDEPAGTDRPSKAGRVARLVINRILLIVLFVLIGLGLRFGLAMLKEPPAQADIPERRIQVEVAKVQLEDVPVTIAGYGEVRPLDLVAITPKVPGEIVAIHPRLEQGEVIPEGELLFRIDPRDYENAKAQAEAQVEQLKNKIARLKEQYRSDQERLKLVSRTRDLAKSEFDRDTALYEKEDVGAQSLVNLSEISYNKVQDAYDQLEQALALYPMGIREAQAGLAAAEAALKQAKLSLERTEVRAPFNARVKMVQLEVGQMAAPGAPVLMLANDAMLEISVPLDSRDARSWLRFREEGPAEGVSWFGEVEPVPCRITWTEQQDGHSWTGTLHRVERFDQMTRTVSVAIRVDTREAARTEHGLPLVDGMFCQVEIPGRTMQQVCRLPRSAVAFEGWVYVAEDGRLQRRTVDVIRNEGEDAFVSGGLEPGELVIVTRLVNPLPNTLLDYTVDDTATTADAGS